MSRLPVPLLAILAFGVSCSRPSQTAEELYAKAEASFRDEQYESALALIPGEAVLMEMKANRDLRDRFRLLRAELLALRPDSGPGLQMLSEPFPPEVAPELERRRKRSLGYGRCRTARTAEGRADGMRILDAVLAETVAGSAEAGMIQLRRGACLRAMGRMPEAEDALRSALRGAEAGRDTFLQAQVLSSLGTLCASGERFDEAAAFTGAALKAAAQAGTAGRNVTRRALDNLGWFQFELGDYERAIDTLSRFEARRESERVVNENNQARTYMAMEDFANAERHYERALTAARTRAGVDAGDEAAVMQGLAMLSYRRGKWFEAARWNSSAMALVEKLQRPDLARNGTLMDARIRIAQGDTAEAEPVLRKVVADPGSSHQLRWTARTELGHVLAAAGRNKEAEKEFEQAMSLVEDSQANLTAAEDRISFVSGRIDVYREALQFLLRQNRTNDALKVAERSRARTLHDGQSARTRRRAATVLFYWLDEPVSHLWVVDPVKGASYFRLPGGKEIQELVERHNQFLLRARNPLTDGGQEARQLYDMLVRPAAAQLTGRRVLISPDGGLHSLNFETLIVPSPDHYWLEDVEISVVPGLDGPPESAAVKSRQILLAGDALEAGESFAPLRHAGEELDRIAAQFGARALRRESATPPAVREALAAGPGYVHFAAHAQANRLRPLESAILLSPSPSGYKLYARQIAGMKLRTHLVTLSACTAAGAKAFRGEGLVGFAWAFLGAGAENVVASLWEVDDASTPQLMEQMYRQLQLGRPPAEALREAKLALLRSGTALQKPYFWGAFLHFQP